MGKGVRVVLDNIIFFLQRSGGGSVYWKEIIQRLDKSQYEITYLEPSSKHNNIFYNELSPTLRHSRVVESGSAKILSFLSSRYRSTRSFIFHSSYYRTARSKRAVNIVTIHDFMPEMFFFGFKRFYHSWRKKQAIKNADGIVCVSSNTCTDLFRFYPEVASKHVTIIPLGISHSYFAIDHMMPKSEGNGDPYIIFVGRRSHYKNFDLVLKVLSLLRGYRLVVAGEEWTPNERKAIALLADRIELVSNPTNEQLNVLYNAAFCLLYPSSYEGFGIPVIEAMAAGCPVVALNASSIPEVANNAALLLDELNPEEFAAAICSLENVTTRNEVIHKGLSNAARFSWDQSVHQLSLFYDTIFQRFGLTGSQEQQNTLTV